MQANTLSPSLPPSSPNVPTLGSKNLFRYKVGFIRDGIRHFVTDWKDNLIMDAGLDKAGNVTSWCGCFSTCLFGNNVSPTPVQRSSGVTTFTQSTTTLTASAGFFVAQDVGRLFKWGTGTAGVEMYITAFTSSTVVTVNVSATVAVPEVGTVWYVNSAALTTVAQTTSTYGANGGDNGTSIVGNVFTHKRTFTGSAVGAPTTLTEIGFSHNTTNSSLFDRDIITGGVALLTGDIPLAVAELIQTINNTTPTTAPNVGTGCTTEGDIQVEWMDLSNGTAWSAVDTSGGTISGNGVCLEPTGTGNVSAILATYSFNTFSTSASAPTGRNQFSATFANGTYTNGVFQRLKSGSLTISQAVGNIFGFGLGNQVSPGTTFVVPNFASVKFDASFAKSGSQTLTFSFLVTWQRILNNV